MPVSTVNKDTSQPLFGAALSEGLYLVHWFLVYKYILHIYSRQFSHYVLTSYIRSYTDIRKEDI
jgi:hypothetical protein